MSKKLAMPGIPMPGMGGPPKPLSRTIFDKFDKDKGGTIDSSEFAFMCMDFGYAFDTEELKIALDQIDTDKSGEIDYDEFCVWWKKSDRFSQLSLDDETLTRINGYTLDFFEVDPKARSLPRAFITASIIAALFLPLPTLVLSSRLPRQENLRAFQSRFSKPLRHPQDQKSCCRLLHCRQTARGDLGRECKPVHIQPVHGLAPQPRHAVLFYYWYCCGYFHCHSADEKTKSGSHRTLLKEVPTLPADQINKPSTLPANVKTAAATSQGAATAAAVKASAPPAKPAAPPGAGVKK